jgi:tRNA threonylcarbamoyladenosine biosynthesis protein TsaB
MKILALELSSGEHSAAVLNPAGAGAITVGEAIETGSRATRPFGLIERALQAAQISREQIQCVVVGLGPGSYTGVRAAIALAQGWQLAGEVKVLGLSSAECVAEEARAEGLRGRIHVVIDAQRREFYLAGYALDGSVALEVEPLRIAGLEQARALEQAGAVLVGPEVRKWFPGGQVLHPRAATLARLAQGRSDFVAGEKLEPIYLRETHFVKAPPPRVLPF